jgi:hypothetical protein
MVLEDNNREGDEKWLEPHILEVRQKRFARRPDMKSEKVEH